MSLVVVLSCQRSLGSGEFGSVMLKLKLDEAAFNEASEGCWADYLSIFAFALNNVSSRDQLQRSQQ